MNNLNPYNPYGQAEMQPVNEVSATTAMMQSRQAQEVQAAMVVAKKFPRDERQSTERILSACMRKGLAENAIYSYSKGGSEITGPSIRLAEALAQNWGNIDFGFIELEQKKGESQVMAYCWDLETNTRQSKIFSVPHVRHTKKGDYPLTDPREIYEMIANQAARRVRSCILGIIPGDVIEAAQKQCEATLVGGDEPIESRVKRMVASFAEFEVTPEMLAGYIGKKIEAFAIQDVVRLGKVYRSLKDGIVGSDYFTNSMKEAVQAPVEQPQTIPEAPTEEEQISLDDV